ncbi:cytochrome P450 4C1 isoform X1 [Manduca sexta]|uniref:cytochrome P450 4C1 isoform X1 n=1 Tax=Manduca sexta TaxID=7130 RepID=UPI00188E6065|nr:cytochrome P450 4C1 isoform X1 [Manduca sexta]
MLWPFIVVFSLLGGFWLSWRYKNRRLIHLASKFPGPKTWPFIGNALLFMVKPEDLSNVVKKLLVQYGDAIRFWLGPDLNVVISDPDDIKALLSSAKTTYKGPQYKYMADVIGEGILSGSGTKWRRHRKIATPNYGKRAIENYTNTFNIEVDSLLTNLRKKRTEQQFNIYDDIVLTTSYAICQTLMGLSKDQTLNLPYLYEVIETSPSMYDTVFNRMTKWYLQIDPIFWLTSAYRRQRYFIKIMSECCQKILQHRMDRLKTLETESKKNLMSNDEDDVRNTEISVIDRFILSQELNAAELIHETFTVFTSSQEASAKISSALLLMMAYYPNYQEKLYAEIKSILGDEDRWVDDDDFKRMPYLEMVFKEVLRLFPIGALLQRTVQEDITISSGTIPAGSSLVIPIYHMHRDVRFWSQPEDFNPERFNPANTAERQPNCYIPFSLGPMDCLGRHFGTKLIKTICVRILNQFEVSSTDKYKDLRLTIAISASPIDGYHLSLRPRSQNNELHVK